MNRILAFLLGLYSLNLAGCGGFDLGPAPATPTPPAAKKVAYLAYMTVGRCSPTTNPQPGRSQQNCVDGVQAQIPAIEQPAYNALHNCLVPHCWPGNGQLCDFVNGERASKCLYCVAANTYDAFSNCHKQALDAGLDPQLSDSSDITRWLKQDLWGPLNP